MRSPAERLARRNRIATWILVCVFVLLYAVGTLFVAGFAALLFAADRLWWALGLGALVGVVVALASLLQTFFRGPDAILHDRRGRPLRKDEQPELHACVEEISALMGIPQPRLWWTEIDELEAFATGRDAEHAVVMLSKAANDLWTPEQRRAVLGHELGHIKNGDLRVTMFVSELQRSLMPIALRLLGLERTLLLDGFWSFLDVFASVLGIGRRRSVEYRDRYGGRTTVTETQADTTEGLIVSLTRSVASFAGATVLAPVALVASIVAGVGWLTMYAVSRQREELADATSAYYTKDPGGLADALERLFEESWARLSRRPERTNVVFIPVRSGVYANCVTPALSHSIVERFGSTHPEHTDRVRRLRKLAEAMSR